MMSDGITFDATGQSGAADTPARMVSGFGQPHYAPSFGHESQLKTTPRAGSASPTPRTAQSAKSGGTPGTGRKVKRIVKVRSSSRRTTHEEDGDGVDPTAAGDEALDTSVPGAVPLGDGDGDDEEYEYEEEEGEEGEGASEGEVDDGGIASLLAQEAPTKPGGKASKTVGSPGAPSAASRLRLASPDGKPKARSASASAKNRLIGGKKEMDVTPDVNPKIHGASVARKVAASARMDSRPVPPTGKSQGAAGNQVVAVPAVPQDGAPDCMRQYKMSDIGFRGIKEIILCLEEPRGGISIPAYYRLYFNFGAGCAPELSVNCHVQYSMKVGQEVAGRYGVSVYGVTYVTLHVPSDLITMFQNAPIILSDGAQERMVDGKMFTPVVTKVRSGLQVSQKYSLADVMREAQSDLYGRAVLSATATDKGTKLSLREFVPVAKSNVSYQRRVTDSGPQAANPFLKSLGMA